MGKKTSKKSGQTPSTQKTTQLNHFKTVTLISIVLVAISALIPLYNNYFKSSPKDETRDSYNKRNRKKPSDLPQEETDDDGGGGVSLVDFLDSYLMTALSSRPAVSIETINLLIQDAQEQSIGSKVAKDKFDLNQPITSYNKQGTGGELTILGYAILLHDVQFVNELLFPTVDKLSTLVSSSQSGGGVNPMAYVGLSPNALQEQQSKGRNKGLILGSFHESALTDSFRPLHLALITKDVVVDAARKFLLRGTTVNDCSERRLRFLTEQSSSSKQNQDSSVIGKLLFSLSPCYNNTTSSSLSQQDDTNSLKRHEIRLQEIMDLIHVELIEPMLMSLFTAIKAYPTTALLTSGDTSNNIEQVATNVYVAMKNERSMKREQEMMGSQAVIAALRTKDRWGRTPLHLAVLSGNRGASAHIIKEWIDAVISLKISEIEHEIEQDLDSNGDDAGGETMADKLPLGFECWLLASMDQLNRTALHYAGLKGDETILNQLSQPLHHHYSVQEETLNMSDEKGKIVNLVLSEMNSCEVVSTLRDVNGYIADELLETALYGNRRRKETEEEGGEGGGERLEKGEGGNEATGTVTREVLEGSRIESGGVYDHGSWNSDSLSLPWLKQEAEVTLMKTSPSKQCDIEIVESDDMSPKRFLIEFLSASKPVLIKGAAKNWNFRTQGANQWNKESFADRFGDFEVLSSSIPYARSFGINATKTTIKQFIDLTSSSSSSATIDDVPDYVFTDRPHASMLRDFPLTPDFLKIAKHLIDPIPASLQFYLGPVGSGSPWHWHGDAWNAIAYGEKIWSLLPPAKAAFSNRHSYHTHFDRPWTNQHRDNTSSSEEATDGSTTSSSSSQDSAVGVIDALHCVQEAGDIMYVPTGWAHAILNTRETVGVASEFRYTFNHFA